MSKLHRKPTIRVQLDDLDPSVDSPMPEILHQIAMGLKEESDAVYWTVHTRNPSPRAARMGDYYENHTRWIRRVLVNVDDMSMSACFKEYTRDCGMFQDPDDSSVWTES